MKARTTCSIVGTNLRIYVCAVFSNQWSWKAQLKKSGKGVAHTLEFISHNCISVRVFEVYSRFYPQIIITNWYRKGLEGQGSLCDVLCLEFVFQQTT